MAELAGRWALVTGASSGLGVEFARQLAALGCNTVLVARREERLRQVAKELEESRGVRTRVVAVSLSEPGAPAGLHRRLSDEGIAIDVLVNNAGFGVYGPFLDIPWEREREMLELDVLAVVELSKLFVKDMVERDFGYVLQVASIGAYQPTPTYATYSAAKAFVLSFGEALSYELRRTHVKVSVVSPGVTATEFLEVSGQRPTLYQRALMMRSDAVVRSGLRAMLRGRPSTIPGVANFLAAFSLRFTPRRLQAALAERAMNWGGGNPPA
jgi:short-subunit dehydrogenase